MTILLMKSQNKRIKLKNKMSDIFEQHIIIEKKRREKLDELFEKHMSEYDRTIYFPSLEKLQQECSKEGHDFNSNNIVYRNSLGDGWIICSKCGFKLEY